jgi:transcriptional regulator CtsR
MMAIKITKSTPPESKEILADAIVRISEAFTKLSASGLNRDAIIILLHDHTKISKRDIKLILDSLSRLRGWYCR